MEHLDLALRGAAIAVLALIAVLMLQDRRLALQGRLSIAAVALSMSALLLLSPLAPLPWPPILAANLTLLASLTPMAITWLIVTIFIDAPGRSWPWLTGAAVVSLAFYLHHIYPSLALLCAALAVPLYGGLLGVSIWHARDDLVECRCRARPAFAAAIAGMSLIFTGLQAIGASAVDTSLYTLAKPAGTLIVSFAMALWLLRPELELWPGPRDPQANAHPRTEPKPDLAGDTRLIAQIREAMEGGIWREEGLTIGALATRLSVPEHRLRRAINQGLGHRNFSSFINAARIDAARAMLSDPAQSGTTILEIAYHVGFASLGPFNRAFRAETGMSPTEYRREADNPHADSENSPPISANLH